MTRGGPAVATFATGVLLVVLGFVFVAIVNGPIWPDAFFDARVFTRAVMMIRDGHNPYALLHGPDPDLNHLPLVQPPHVAWALEGLAWTGVLPLALDAIVSLLIAAGVVVGVGVSIRELFGVRVPEAALGVGVFAVFIAGSGMIVLVTGNVSGLFWGLFIAAAVHGFHRERWTPFHAAVLLGVLFKPLFVTLWIIPVLARGWSWRQVWIGGACTASAAAVYAGGIALRPDLANAWYAAMESRRVLGDIGSGLFSYVVRMPYPYVGEKAALLAHALYALGLLACLVFTKAHGRMRLAALLVAANAMNPRLNAYDYAFAALPAFYIYATRLEELFGATRGRLSSLALALAVSALSMFVFKWDIYYNNLTIVVIMGGAVACATQWERLARLLAQRATAPADRLADRRRA